jgi:hypothetical protein
MDTTGHKISWYWCNSASQQGYSVALSADGNTLAVGGNQDSSGAGATWIFTRSAGVWTQQGTKLVGTGATGGAAQGYSVALSADGNTLAVGGSFDNSSTGAIWIFTRSAGVWTQQGTKLVGTGGVTTQRQGYPVCLSADGNTLAALGGVDNSNVGAVWIFTRTSGVWTQQGTKIVATTSAIFPNYLALSADGTTFAINDDANTPNGIWVFLKNTSTNTWQNQRITAVGGSNVNLGRGIALSGDGNILAAGGYVDNSFVGATWIFVRSGGIWYQQGTKLVGTGATGSAYQGYNVALSSNGNTLAVGAWQDNTQVGATWIFI